MLLICLLHTWKKESDVKVSNFSIGKLSNAFDELPSMSRYFVRKGRVSANLCFLFLFFFSVITSQRIIFLIPKPCGQFLFKANNKDSIAQRSWSIVFEMVLNMHRGQGGYRCIKHVQIIFLLKDFLICSFPYETKMLILLKINNKSTRMSSCGVFPVILLSLLRSTSIVNSLSFLFNILIFLKNKLALLSLWGRGLTEKGKNDTAGCPLTRWFKEPTRKVLKIKQNQSEFHYSRSKV